jgi:hypothetical protein
MLFAMIILLKEEKIHSLKKMKIFTEFVIIVKKNTTKNKFLMNLTINYNKCWMKFN